MLQPKRRKYIKEFRGRRHGVATRGNAISFGDFAMKSQGVAWVTSAQIEAARRTITHGLRKGGRVWVRIFPDKPITARPAGKRMGGGKGDISTYVAVVRPGTILFEVAGADRDIVKEAFRKASAKLPIDIKIVSREED
jgi:large subunit ribosomal protein L16